MLLRLMRKEKSMEPCGRSASDMTVRMCPTVSYRLVVYQILALSNPNTATSQPWISEGALIS